MRNTMRKSKKNSKLEPMIAERATKKRIPASHSTTPGALLHLVPPPEVTTTPSVKHEEPTVGLVTRVGRFLWSSGASVVQSVRRHPSMAVSAIVGLGALVAGGVAVGVGATRG